jgi:hypothetical protein
MTARSLAFASVIAFALLAPGDAAAAGPSANEFQLAAGYAAKEACSCAFVEGQTDAYCTSYGISPTGVSVTLTIDHSASSVTATYATSTRTASFVAGAGCTLAGF